LKMHSFPVSSNLTKLISRDLLSNNLVSRYSLIIVW
jgi:hypothetical protein